MKTIIFIGGTAAISTIIWHLVDPVSWGPSITIGVVALGMAALGIFAPDSLLNKLGR